jgi:hypothetical protein
VFQNADFSPHSRLPVGQTPSLGDFEFAWLRDVFVVETSL